MGLWGTFLTHIIAQANRAISCELELQTAVSARGEQMQLYTCRNKCQDSGSYKNSLPQRVMISGAETLGIAGMEWLQARACLEMRVCSGMRI
jgi:hypothetical protein